jgi:hypothetical protein
MLDTSRFDELAEVIEPQQLEDLEDEQEAVLTAKQKLAFSERLDRALADAVVGAVETLARISQSSRNDQAATSASRMLLSLANKRGVLKTNPGDEFLEALNDLQAS